jgi:hypothetical protein
VQIDRIELARLFQPPVQHLQGAPQVLKHPVDVHGRQPQRIGQFRLGHGQGDDMVLRQLDGPQPHHVG